jgi:hypothetical protein
MSKNTLSSFPKALQEVYYAGSLAAGENSCFRAQFWRIKSSSSFVILIVLADRDW